MYTKFELQNECQLGNAGMKERKGKKSEQTFSFLES